MIDVDHETREWVMDCVAHGARARPWPVHVLALMAAHDIGAPVSRDVLRAELRRNGYKIKLDRYDCIEVVSCAVVYPNGRFRK
jgi:hypothetical protein